MRKTGLKLALALVIGFAFPMLANADDRKPNEKELAYITKALHKYGYSSWDEIEWSHDYWDVDDAEYSDGKDYDLLLDPRTLKIVKKE